MNIQEMMLQQLKRNPNYQRVINFVGNRNPRDVFYEECEKRKIDPSEILSMLHMKGD